MGTGFVRKAVALALVLCLALLCAACAKQETFKDYYKDVNYTDPYPLLNKLDKLDEFTGWGLFDSWDEFLVFYGGQGMKFYNVEKQTNVLELAAAAMVVDVQFFEAGGHTFFAIQSYGELTVTNEVPAVTEPVAEAPMPTEAVESEEVTGIEPFSPVIKIYDENGTEVATTDSFDKIDAAEDLLEVDGVIYRVDDKGSLKQISANPFSGGIPYFDYKAGDYYYVLDPEVVIVYDEDLNEVFFWELPYSDVSECNVFPLGENVLVQMATVLPEAEVEFDCIIEGEKYALETLILDPQKGSVKTADLDYIVLYASGYGEETAVIGMIENGRVQDAESAMKKVRLNSKTGEIEAELLTDVYGYVTPLVEDRFFYYTYSEDVYLIDGNGKTIGKVTALGNLSSSSRNESCFAYNGRLYNYNLEEIFNFAEQKLTVYAMLGHSVIFQNEEGYYVLYTQSGELKPLDSNAQGLIWSKQFYMLTYEDRYMLPFNEEGVYLNQELKNTRYNTIFSGDSEIYISVSAPEGTEYYKMYQAPVEK